MQLVEEVFLGSLFLGQEQSDRALHVLGLREEEAS